MKTPTPAVKKKKSVLRRILKVLAWIIGSILMLFILLAILIQIPAIQNFAVNKAVNYLEGKIGTPVHLDRIAISFPKKVVLKGIFLQDQQKDTLLYAEDIRIDISLFKLISSTVELNEVNLKGITSHIQRSAAGRFNFDYIIDAFASEDTTTSEGPGMAFSINDIILDKINIKYHDDFMGYDIDFALDHFDTDIKTFDLDKQNFKIDEINIDGLTTAIRQYKPLAEKLPKVDSTDNPPETTLPEIALNRLTVSRINFDYQNEIDSVFSNVQLGKLSVDPEKLDLNKQSIRLDELNLENTTAVIRLGKDEGAKEVAKKVNEGADSVAQIAKEQGWKIAVDKTNLQNNRFKYDDDNSKPIAAGMDYSHLDIDKIRLETRDLYYYSDSISGKIDHLSFYDKSGANVKDLTTDFLYTDRQAYLKDLDLQTEETHIKKRDIIVRYPSIASLSDNIGAMEIETDLAGTVISLKDVAYFVPSLGTEPLFQKYRNTKLNANIQLSGRIDNLEIKRLELYGLKRTRVNVSGVLKGLPNADNLYANLNIKELSSSETDLLSILPKGTLPDNIRIPSQFSVKGSIKGGMKNAETSLNLSSSFGNARIKAITSNITDSIRAKYNADVSLAAFNIGKLLKQDTTIGRVSMKAHVVGTGYAVSKMNADMDAEVQSAELMGYTYKDLVMTGKLQDGIADVNADIDDPNIDLDLVAQMDLRNSKPSIKADVMIDSADLKALHLYDDDFRIHTRITADFAEVDADQPIGELLISGTLVQTGSKRYTVDSAKVVASKVDTLYTITVNSPVAELKLAGNYTLGGIGTASMQIIDRYYQIGAPQTEVPIQIANLEGTIFKSSLLDELMPDLKLSRNISFQGAINSAENLIVFLAIAPELTYGDHHVDSAKIYVQTVSHSIVYAAAVTDYSNPNMKIPFASLSGSMANNELTYQLQVQDPKKVNQYNVAGTLNQNDGEYTLQLENDSLRLNYEKWNIDPQNKIVFGKNGINASNFKLSNNNQSLSINSTSPQMDAPINVALDNFKIETISSIVNSDSLFMGGTINGEAKVTDVTKDPLFDANLTVKDFNYKRDTLGDIVIKADNLTPESYTAHVTISGKGNDVDINGKYITSGEGGLDFDLAIKSLNLATVESFTAGQLRDMSGDIHGNLRITGTPSKPKIIGDINMDKTKLVVSQFNSLFTIDSDKIQFREDGIHLDAFTIKDSSGNTAVIDGQVYTTDYNNFRFNLDLEAHNFQVLNSKKKDNPLYYGLLFIDADATVRGDMNKPVVNGDLTVNSNTDLTIVIPQTDPQVSRRESIVEFFDQDHPELDSIMKQAADSLNHADIQGYELTANVTIDPKATFNIIVDEANGDFLSVKGDGNLSAQMDETGDITLTGSYVLKEGSYQMSVNFLKRKFDIEEGSTLTWTGEPTAADIDITALYKTRAAPIDLVEKQLADLPDDVKNTYRQKIPFEVNLIMKGELLKPELSFDIILPDGNYNVATEIIDATKAKLAEIRREPSELNKQVFSLLLMNRFMADNPFEFGNSTSVSTMARQSVSKLLTEQLNRMAADIIHGVDIELGVESQDDYTTGSQQTRTDVNLGVSKRLFNDRLKVSVGSNFEVEGPTQKNEKTTNIAGDIQVEYKLTRDGRYLMRGYRKDQYEVALQGQVVETGLKFILSIDYDYWREIIERSKDKKRERRLRKDEKKEEKSSN